VKADCILSHLLARNLVGNGLDHTAASGASTAVEEHGMNGRQAHWYLNPSPAVVLLVFLALGTGGVLALNEVQEPRVLSSGLKQAKAFLDEGQAEIARQHLTRYLEYRPDDAVALDLLGDVLVKTANGPGQRIAAANVYEKLLRTDPDGPLSQTARRRLVELYIRHSDAVMASATFQVSPEFVMTELRYQAAERVARELIKRGGTGSEDHRLLAMALEGRVLPGDDSTLDEAIDEYTLVLKLNPGDVYAAEHLAWLFKDSKRNAARGERVLDDLLNTLPDAAEVRLARHRFFASLRRKDRASAELEAAARLAPDDLQVLLSVARDAMRRGDTARARRLLQRFPETAKADLRVVALRGKLDLSDEHLDDAIEDWRQGLKRSGGSDSELSWWLAYTLLQRGLFKEARPLVAQFRRLEGEEAPLLQVLEAMREERTGLATKAIPRLQRVLDRLDKRWQRTVNIALGRCYEILSDEPRAIESYRKAIQLEPGEPTPRLATARLLSARRPDEAVEEIERGLTVIPDEPGLLVALANAHLRRQLQLPLNRRSWTEFEQAVRRAEAAAPADPMIALLLAERALQTGEPDDSARILQDAVARDPKSEILVLALSQSLSHTGRLDRALAVLERASAPEGVGDRAAVRIERARLMTLRGRGRAARGTLGHGIDKLPRGDRPRVLVALGRLLAGQGDMAGARQAYNRASDIEPEDPQPRLELLELALGAGDDDAIHEIVEALYRRGGENDLGFQLAKAAELVRKAASRDATADVRNDSLTQASLLVDAVLADAPGLPGALLLRANILERRNRLDDAIAAYRRTWEHGFEPALPRLVSLLAKRHRVDDLDQIRKATPSTLMDRLSVQELLRAGDPAQAARVAEEAHRDRPDDKEWQAGLYDRLGRTKDAETALRKEIERRPGELASWLPLIRFLAKHERSAEIDPTIEKVRQNVKTGQPELLLARCYSAASDHSRAEKAFEAALARYRDDAEVAMSAASYYERVGRPMNAEAALAQACRSSPASREAARRLALAISARAGNDGHAWDKAWSTLGTEVPTEEPGDRLARGIVLTRSPDPGRRKLGVDRLEALLDDVPVDHPAALAAREHLTRFLLETGQPDRAIGFAAVSAVRGSDATAIALYVQALLSARKLDEAESQIDRLASLNPGDPREVRLRVLLTWERAQPSGDPEALERAYLDRAEAPGGEALGRETFLRLASLGPRAGPVAERLGRRLAARTPGASWMPALVLSRTGRRAEALSLCLTAVRSGDETDISQASRVALGCATAASEDAATLRAADGVIGEAIRRSPSSDDLLAIRAMLLHQKRQYQDEVRAYRDLVSRHPTSFLILNNLAWALSEGLNQPSAAFEQIEAVIRAAGRNAAFLDTRGLILTRLGRHGEAIEDLEETVEVDPTALHLFHLAHAYREAGRLNDCRRTLERVREEGLTADEVDPGERDLFRQLLAP
jgi:tetratricopeptide (TPR) repeat protein